MLELLQNGTYLNYAIVAISLACIAIGVRIFLMKKNTADEFNFEAEYNKILNSDEFKVKRKHEV